MSGYLKPVGLNSQSPITAMSSALVIYKHKLDYAVMNSRVSGPFLV